MVNIPTYWGQCTCYVNLLSSLYLDCSNMAVFHPSQIIYFLVIMLIVGSNHLNQFASYLPTRYVYIFKFVNIQNYHRVTISKSFHKTFQIRSNTRKTSFYYVAITSVPPSTEYTVSTMSVVDVLKFEHGKHLPIVSIVYQLVSFYFIQKIHYILSSGNYRRQNLLLSWGTIAWSSEYGTNSTINAPHRLISLWS